MIISIWGNNGSGVSTLALKLALSFAEKQKNTVLVDTNFIAPQTKIWFPEADFPPDCSLASILANNVEMDKVASKVTMIDPPYLGVIGYGRDLSINSIPSRDDTPSEFLSILNNLCDIVIVDCQPNITQDVMSFMAVDLSDVKILNMTPDLRGLAWHDANVLMLRDKWNSQHSQVVKVFNKAHLNAPIDAIASNIGSLDFYLPYFPEIEQQFYDGEMGHKGYKGHAKKYGEIVDNLRDFLLSSKQTVKTVPPPAPDYKSDFKDEDTFNPDNTTATAYDDGDEDF